MLPMVTGATRHKLFLLFVERKHGRNVAGKKRKTLMHGLFFNRISSFTSKQKFLFKNKGREAYIRMSHC